VCPLSVSRSEWQNGQPFPSVSVYTKPSVNADGSIDIVFGPDEPTQVKNLRRALTNLASRITALQRNFADDLYVVFGRSISRELATEIYRALCNVDWFHEDGSRFGCTWRSAGATVAELRGEGEDYLDYYCSGNEGYVADSVSGPLAERGWTWRQMD